MSVEQPEQFRLEMDDGHVIERDAMVEHIEHGPMYCDGVTVGPAGRRISFEGEMGPVGVTLSEEDLREAWGETMHCDPAELYSPGEVRIENSGISTDDSDIEVSIETNGKPQSDAERVHLYAVDAAVRAIQAHENECDPDECEGSQIEFDWESLFDDEEVSGE